MAYKKSEKVAIEVWASRFYRRAAGRITKVEARKAGRMYGASLHYTRTNADKLTLRAANGFSFSKSWEAYKAHWRTDVARHLGYFFGWYGPNSGLWPGMKLKLAPPDTCGRYGGWVIDPAFTG